MINILEAFVLFSIFIVQIKIIYKILSLFAGKPFFEKKLELLCYLKYDESLKNNSELQQKINEIEEIKNKSAKKRKIITIFALLVSLISIIFFWSCNICVSNCCPRGILCFPRGVDMVQGRSM